MRPLADIARKMRAARSAFPVVILALMVASFLILPQFLGGKVNSYGVYAILQTAADFGLITLAIGLTMIMAEYDLSSAATYGLGALIAVKIGEHSIVLGVAVAAAIGMVTGFLQGGIMARLNMSSVEVTLGGLLIITGITEVIAHNETVPFSNFTVGLNLDKQILSVFSLRSLIVIGIFVAIAAVMYFTKLGPEIRSVGGDRRSSRISGVPVKRTIAGVMALGGACAAFGGALDGYSVASAAPNVGLEPLVFGTISAILGGVTLKGGHGNPLGIFCGVLSLATLQQTLVVISAPAYVSSIVTGMLLVIVTLVTAPDIRELPIVRDIRRVVIRRRTLADESQASIVELPTGQG